MDLVGGIKYLENRLGGRKPNHGKGKSGQKNSRSEAVQQKSAQADSNSSTAASSARLRQKIDIVV